MSSIIKVRTIPWVEGQSLHFNRGTEFLGVHLDRGRVKLSVQYDEENSLLEIRPIYIKSQGSIITYPGEQFIGMIMNPAQSAVGYVFVGQRS